MGNQAFNRGGFRYLEQSPRLQEIVEVATQTILVHIISVS
jgi:hypothetical protein